MSATEGDMAFSVLRRIIRHLPASIPIVGILALITVVWSQNQTSVTRDGDFFVMTPADECEHFPRRTRDDESGFPKVDDEARGSTSSGPGVSRTALQPVARKYVMRRRAGFQAFGRGHSVVHKSEIPEFHDQSLFLRRMNVHLKQRCLEAGREFTEVDWSTVIDGFRDPSFSYLNWEGDTSIEFVFVSPEAVSFAEFCYEYTGGAHGNLWVSGRNFISDRDGIRELALSDLFENDTDWQRTLLQACLRDLYHQGASRVGESCFDDPMESGFSIEDLRSFTLSAEGIRFYFSPYHMGCYAEGLYSVHVPYSAMIDFVSDTSPLRYFMAAEIPTVGKAGD